MLEKKFCVFYAVTILNIVGVHMEKAVVIDLKHFIFLLQAWDKAYTSSTQHADP